MKLIGYCRVSTAEQADKGISIDAQETDIRRYCEIYKQHTLLDIVRDEGFSGRDLHRPGIQQTINQIKVGQAEGILVAKLDRLSRSVRDLGNMANDGILGNAAILSVHEQIDTSTPAGRLIFHMLAAVAQWERETIVDRIKRALSHLRESGVHLGEIPYGYDRTNERDEHGRLKLIENPEEMGVIRLILACRADEKPMSYEHIARMLDAQGIAPKKKGEKWHRFGVWRIVHRCNGVF